MERFTRLLKTCMFEGKSSVMVLKGDHGAGKSHLLKFFRYAVNNELLNASENNALAVYIKSVGQDFRDMYLFFADDLGRDLLTIIATDSIKKYLKEIGTDQASSYIYEKEAKKVQFDSLSLEQYLASSRHLDLFRKIRAAHFNDFANSDFVYALLNLVHPDHSQLAWRWFHGENLDRNDKESLLIDNNISDDEMAHEIFDSTVKLLLRRVKALVILLDEFEKMTLIHRPRREQYMDEIRRFMDENTSGMCLLITVTPTALDTLFEHPSALERRLKGNDMDLKYFESKEIEELIMRYLTLGRTADSNIEQLVKKYPSTTKELYPFTLQAIEKIQELSEGLVSEVVNLCRESIEKGIDLAEELIDIEIVVRVKSTMK